MKTGPTVLVLTGSIGMGKTTTAAMFADLGIPIWDADATVRKLYDVGGAAVGAIGQIAPDAIRNDKVDREMLRRLISKTPQLLSDIEDRVHPLVAKDRSAFLKDHSEAEIVLLDIPLFFETGASVRADKVVVVSVPEDIQRERVLSRGTMSETEFALIKSRQLPDAQKRKRADVVIETLTLEQTRADVEHLVRTLRGRDA